MTVRHVNMMVIVQSRLCIFKEGVGIMLSGNNPTLFEVDESHEGIRLIRIADKKKEVNEDG